MYQLFPVYRVEQLESLPIKKLFFTGLTWQLQAKASLRYNTGVNSEAGPKNILISTLGDDP